MGRTKMNLLCHSKKCIGRAAPKLIHSFIQQCHWGTRFFPFLLTDSYCGYLTVSRQQPWLQLSHKQYSPSHNKHPKLSGVKQQLSYNAHRFCGSRNRTGSSVDHLPLQFGVATRLKGFLSELIYVKNWKQFLAQVKPPICVYCCHFYYFRIFFFPNTKKTLPFVPFLPA